MKILTVLFAATLAVSAAQGQSFGELAGGKTVSKPEVKKAEPLALVSAVPASAPARSAVLEQKIDDIKKKSAEGDPASMLALGSFYAAGTNGFQVDAARAMELVSAAAEKDFVPAQVYLGYLYGEGKIVPRDFAKAVHWRELAASKGDANDKWTLGSAYLYGFRLPKDQVRALFWIRQAGEGGNVESIVKLVEIYKNINNAEELEIWTKRLADVELASAKAGNAAVMTDIAKKYMKGIGGFPRSRAQGIFWFKEASDKGEREAMEILAKFYASGRFVERDHDKAKALFEKLAETDPDYCWRVAEFYSQGAEGFPVDLERAAYWYERGAQTMNDVNRLQLAFKFWTGAGVKKNVEKALYWSKKVSESGTESKYIRDRSAAKKMTADILSNSQPPANISVYYK